MNKIFLYGLPFIFLFACSNYSSADEVIQGTSTNAKYLYQYVLDKNEIWKGKTVPCPLDVTATCYEDPKIEYSYEGTNYKMNLKSGVDKTTVQGHIAAFDAGFTPPAKRNLKNEIESAFTDSKQQKLIKEIMGVE